MVSPNVVVVSRALAVQQEFARVLCSRDLTLIIASTANEAKTIWERHPISLIFCSDEMPDCDLDDLLRQSSKPLSRIPTVIVSRLDEWERFLNFMGKGAFDYVLFPFNDVEIERVVDNALSIVRIAKERQLRAVH